MTNIALYILIGLFVLVGVLLIILFLIKRGDKDDTAHTQNASRLPMKDLELCVIKGAATGQRHALTRREITLGSSAKSDIVIAEAGVSPLHASVRAESGRLVLLDHNSQNGIWANGRRVFAAVLVPGSQFQIGTSVFALLPARSSLPRAANHLEAKSSRAAVGASENVSARGYERLEQIGSGGQATVYRARSKSDNGFVAIKYLNNMPADDDRRFFLQKFKQQILVGTTIRHRHCVRILGGDPNNNPPFLIEELIAGETLRDRMVRGRLPFEACVRILGEVCDALYYLHRKNLIHRDVKPSNIMFDANGAVKLIDFGLIRIAGAPRITQIGMCLGTPHYMSVEQVRGDSSRITSQSDLYSLGVVAYELFTGVLPFDGSNDTIMTLHLKSKPRPPHEIEQHLPERISQAVLRALEKDPARRFADAREMANTFGYSQPFHEGDPLGVNAASGLVLRLQNVSGGAVIQIQSSPTVLSRSLVNSADKLISREHGKVYWQDGFWRVAEQAGHPTNGLYINGLRVDDEGDVIQPGDEIRLGQTVLRVIQ